MSSREKYRIDGHKLHLHPQRVADWLAGHNITPIYVEISPSGACNHRCRFCGLDFMGYRPRYLPAGRYCLAVEEMRAAGVKAVMFAGEGEPLAHRDIGLMTRATKEAGIDVAFTTNGVLFTPERAREILPFTSWIKISFNAGRPETYAQIHRAQPRDYATVIANIKEAVRLRTELGSGCTLGAQMVLLPENQAEAPFLARTMRDLGVDYLVIKPHSVHRLSANRDYDQLKYDDCRELAAELSRLDTAAFKTIFRTEAIGRRDGGAGPRQRCLALPFWAYVDSGGSVWSCLRHINEERFYLGDFLKDGLREVFQGAQRQANLAWCAEHLDISDCHADCRMEPINVYLWELTHPGAHDNFI